MQRNGQHESARHIRRKAFRHVRPQASFYKKTLIVVSYATAYVIVALAMGYWPASAGNILTKINVLPTQLISAPDPSNRIYKADPRSSVSFEERWIAVPTSPDDKDRREAPRSERHIERIPFSCELAFSRLVTKGNFSTRCIAGLETSKIDT